MQRMMEWLKLSIICFILVEVGTVIQGQANVEILDSCSARVRLSCLDQVVTDLDCEYSAVWHVRGDDIQFTITSNSTGWIAIGFSDSQSMLSSDIVVGASDGSNSFVEERNVLNTRVEPQLEAMGANVTTMIEYVDGITQLKFTRPRVTVDDRPLTMPVFLIFAWGNTVDYDANSIGQHAMNNRAFSTASFVFPDLPSKCPPGCPRQVPPLYLYKQDCVETCPQPTATTPYFGNYMTNSCEELLIQDEDGNPFVARLNATRYIGEVLPETELGTRVAYCSVIINKNNFILVQSVLFTTFREENKLKLLLPNGLITNSGMVTTFPGYNNSEESFYYLTVAIVLTEQPTTTGVMLELDIGCVVAGKTDTDPYAINSAAVLSVNVVAPLVPLSITSSSMNATAAFGESVNFTCTATAQSLPTISWWRVDNRNGIKTPINITSGSYSVLQVVIEREIISTLTILEVELRDTGEYVCIAELLSQFPSIEESAILTVVYAPDFFLTPNSTVEANYTASLILTCVAFGVPTPSVRWERLDGQSLESANISLERWNRAGTEFVFSTLELYRVQQSDGGLYSCTASNSAGDKQYNFTVVLLLVSPIVVPIGGDSATSIRGSTYQLEFKIERASPPVEIENRIWTYINLTSGQAGINVSELDTTRFSLDAYRLTLTISVVNLFDDGVFSLTVSNLAGVHTASINYTVYVKPLVQKYTDGDDYTIGEEQPITFQCIADGIPVPNIIWTRNGELISLNPRFVIASAIIRASYRPNITHALQSNLTVTSVLVADTGDFLCTASNSVGRDFLFSPFVLNVTAKPTDFCESSPCMNRGTCFNQRLSFLCICTDNWAGTDCSQFVQMDKGAEIITHPSDTAVDLFEAVELTCKVDGVPRPRITWFKNGVEIKEEVFDILRISEVNLNNRGFYNCLAENDIRASETTVQLMQVNSTTAVLNIRNIAQYKASVEFKNITTSDDIIQLVNRLAVGAELNLNDETIFSVSAQEGINANATRIPILVTVISDQGGSDALLELLKMKLTDIATQVAKENNLVLIISGVERFDGCTSEETINRFEADSLLDIILEWSESNIGEEPVILCPCSNLTLVNGQLNTASRRCGGDFIVGASWEEPKDSACDFTEVARRLCRISEIKDVEVAVVQLGEITEETDMIQALEVSITTSLLELFTEEVTELEDKNFTERFLNIIDNVIAVDMEVLQQSQEMSNSSARILETVQFVTNNIPIPENESTVVISLKSFAVAVQEVLPDEFVEQTFSAIINHSVKGTQDITDDSLVFGKSTAATASISLPGNIFMRLPTSTFARITNTVYLNDALFLRREANFSKVGSLVISAGIVGNVTIEDLSPPIRLTFIRNPDLQHGTKPLCTFWDPTADDHNGNWSTIGCTVVHQTKLSVDCTCDHLTNFAILLDVSPITEPTPSPTVPKRLLEAFSFAGIILSIVCLIFTIVTYLNAPKLRQSEASQLLLLLCFAFLGIYFAYIFAYFATPVPGLCAVAGALVHYTLLVTFVTMAAEAIHMFLKIVLIFTSVQRYVAKAGTIAWLAPLFITVFCLAPDYRNYTSINFCRPYGIPFYVGLLIPFVIIYIFNWVIFVAVLVRIMKQQRDTKLRQDITTTKQIRQQLISAIVLSLLFGLGWGFALPATQGINNTVVQILFQAIYIALTAFQGVFIFIMHCLVGRKSIIARQEWKRWVRRVSSRLGIHSSGDYSLGRAHKWLKHSGKDSTLGMTVTSDSTDQRTNPYDPYTLPHKAMPLSSSVVEFESMFNLSVVELDTLERAVKPEEDNITVFAAPAAINISQDCVERVDSAIIPPSPPSSIATPSCILGTSIALETIDKQAGLDTSLMAESMVDTHLM